MARGRLRPGSLSAAVKAEYKSKSVLTIHRNTATGTTSKNTATFLSSFRHGSMHAVSLSYLTTQASAW